MANQNAYPKILWGASFANTLSFGEPLDNALSYSVAREGSEWVQGASGLRDSWITGTDERLQAVVHRIPIDATVTPLASGWDGATGWRAFFDWARAMNPFRFYPDRDLTDYITCYLIEPLQGPPAELEDDGTRRVRLEIESVDGTAFEDY